MAGKSGTFGSLIAFVKADVSDFKKGMGQARDEVDKTGKKTSWFFKSLKAEFGKSSTLGQSLKLIAGGGAVGSLTMAGSKLKDFTGNLLEMQKALKAGTVTMGEFAEKTAESIPVLGQFWQAGRNIREMITGEQAELEKGLLVIQRRTTAWNNSTKAIQDAERAMRATSQTWADLREKLGQQTELVGLKEPIRGLRELDMEATKAKDEVKQKIDAATKAWSDALNTAAKRPFTTTAERDAFNNVVDSLFKINTDTFNEGQKTLTEIAKNESARRKVILNNEVDTWRGKWEEIKSVARRAVVGVAEKLAEPIKAEIKVQQLPNPRVDAEEIFGKRTVSNADVPQPFVELQNTAKQQLEEQKRTTATTAEVVTALGSAMSNVVTITGVW